MHNTSVDTHYCPSLCFRALKRLGLAGGESTGEDENVAEELGEVGEAFNFAPPVAGGPIFTLVYQIPGYLDPAQPEQMMEIFELVGDFVQTGNIERICGRFPEKTEEWDLWYIESLINVLLHPFAGREQDVLRLVGIFSGYLEQLWPQYLDEFSGWSKEFDTDAWEAELQMSRVVDSWEAVMETSYPYRGFTMVACPETPSTASSLGPDKIILGARHGIDGARDSLVHEVGVRMPGLHRLVEHPATTGLMADDYVGMLRLLEAETCFRKPEVMQELGWEYDAQGDGFLHGKMGLQSLVQIRENLCTSGDLPEMFADWYQEARREGYL